MDLCCVRGIGPLIGSDETCLATFDFLSGWKETPLPWQVPPQTIEQFRCFSVVDVGDPLWQESIYHWWQPMMEWGVVMCKSKTTRQRIPQSWCVLHQHDVFSCFLKLHTQGRGLVLQFQWVLIINFYNPKAQSLKGNKNQRSSFNIRKREAPLRMPFGKSDCCI